jgi:hypothetical protein
LDEVTTDIILSFKEKEEPVPDWYHVDVVTTTIHWTFKDPVVGSGEAEPVEPFLLDDIMTNPIGSYWHQLYPEYSRYFKITSWDDNSGEPDTDPNGVFDPSDQFDFIYLDDDPPVTVWAHLDEVTTDIILSFKEKEEPVPEFPFGVNLLMLLAPIVPLIYLWRLRKKVAKQ